MTGDLRADTQQDVKGVPAPARPKSRHLHRDAKAPEADGTGRPEASPKRAPQDDRTSHADAAHRRPSPSGRMRRRARKTRRERPNIDRSFAERFVVVDLETNPDRADPREHEIIEIGACLVERGRITEELSVLVQPSRPLVAAIRRLTGISTAELEFAVPLPEALEQLLGFVGRLPVAAYNGLTYDFVVLDAACEREGYAPLPGLRLDVLELAHLVFPRAGDDLPLATDGSRPIPSRQLADVADALGICRADPAHRALNDARVTVAVLHACVEVLNRRDPVRALQRWVLEWGAQPWAAFLNTEATRPALEDAISRQAAWGRRPGSTHFSPEEAVAPLAEGGSLVGGERSYRPQQLQMARLVARAFAERSRRMIEAPTGTGKTLAYLVPALAWARASGAPVVIATHFKVLQNQVVNTVRELEAVCGGIRWVLLKGRENYVSVAALDDALDDPPEDPDEALALAIITAWAAQTPTGQWDDLEVWAIEHRNPRVDALRWRLRVTQPPEPPAHELDRRCFYRLALDRLEGGEIIVMNHALLVRRDDWHTISKDLVLDEAHNLEDAATGALTEELTSRLLYRRLDLVHDAERGWGTLARYLDATDTPEGDERALAVLDALDDARAAAETLSDRLVTYTRSRAGARREHAERFGITYRLRPGLDLTRPSYRPVIAAAQRARDALLALSERLGALVVPETVRAPYRRRRLEDELRRVGRELREAAQVLATVPWCHADDRRINIVDLELDDDVWHWGLRSVPIAVALDLSQLWDELDAVVLTSATLTVAGSFTHLIERLGLGSVSQATSLPSPFANLPERHLMVLPNHLPTPQGALIDEFAREACAEIARLILLTSGRALVLFTARARMAAARDFSRPLLEQHQLPVLCQGEQPSPALVAEMKANPATSLLATRSFWEGIDIPGEALSLLIIEKIPFDSPADPVVAARMEAIELRGRDPFSQYLVPQAVLRLVQGVGRLIRSEDDIGVTVILDRRLRQPVSYRETFLQSLPGPPRITRPPTPHDGYTAIARHLGIDLDRTRLLADVPTPDDWHDVTALRLTDDDLADPDKVDQVLEAIRPRLGFPSWQPHQRDLITRILGGEDVLAVLPTGSGKSATFQIPALILDGLTIVISPLIALMRDQVEKLRALGLTNVGAIHAGMPQREQDEWLARARNGTCKLLYVSPERLWQGRFKALLNGVRIARIVVDEAHCISQWGHSFRPEYARIPAALRDLCPDRRPPIVALTATATKHVRDDIVRLLDLRLVSEPLVTSPDRPELHYFIERCTDRNDRDLRVVTIMEAFRGRPAIVYVPRRADTNRVAGLLRAANHVVRPYHGGMDAPERLHTEEAFRHGEIDVVVATKAFGLGIDKPDIAVIIHLEMPASVEEYVQETGRAARGARFGTGPDKGSCILLTAPRDMSIHRAFIRNATPELADVKAVWEVLTRGPVRLPPETLATQAGLDSDAVEAVTLAVHYLVEDGAVQRHADLVIAGRVYVPGDVDQLLEEQTAIDPGEAKPLLAAIRALGDENYNVETWSRRLGCPPDVLERRLFELVVAGLIDFSTWQLGWHLERVAGAEPDWAAIERRCAERRYLVKKLADDAKGYARQDSQCRRAWLLRYLGTEGVAERCTACDVCDPTPAPPWRSVDITFEQLVDALPAKAVLMTVLQDGGEGRSRHTIAHALCGSSRFESSLKEHNAYGRLQPLGLDRILALIDECVAEGLIHIERAEHKGARYDRVVLTRKGRHWR